jgi:hypothetical protein
MAPPHGDGDSLRRSDLEDGRCFRRRLSLVSWMMIVPPVTLIQLAPVSLAGWGVREAALVVVLGSFGVPAEAALAISVLVGLCLILVGLPGGLIWLGDWDMAPLPTPKRPTSRGFD